MRRFAGSVARRSLLSAVAGIAFSSVGAASAFAQAPSDPARQEPLPTLVVGASAEIRVAPDRAELAVAVESRARTAAQASSDNARVQSAVLEAIRRQGIAGPQLQTRSMQVSPEYQYPREGGRPTVTGYVARNEVVVTLSDLAKVGPVIDAALGQGATSISGPRFMLSNPDSARREALDAAVRKAMADAQVMARAAGVRVGRVLEMSTHSGTENFEAARPAVMMRASADAVATPIESGTITVQASVQMRVAIFP